MKTLPLSSSPGRPTAGRRGRTRCRGLALAAAGCLLVGLPSGHPPCRAAGPTLPPDDPAVLRWEPEVAALEGVDRQEPDPPGAILFIGSSSVRLWDSIAADMAPWPVIRRGYGGARYRDLCHFASRLVAPHRPRAIVVFVANDITTAAGPPPVEAVMDDVRATQAAIRRSHLAVPVFYVAVTPTESRWAAWPRIRRLNGAIEQFAEAEEQTFFIATAERYLDPAAGTPRAELFQRDRLHLNPAGYRIWAECISAAVAAELGSPRDLQPAADDRP